MKILVSGICGFVGKALAEFLLDHSPAGELRITGMDNLARTGSWLNRAELKRRGVKVLHGDIRQPSDLESVGDVDWIIDAAAIPAVMSGVDGKTSSRQLVEHNLLGTVNLLEQCRKSGAGFLLISTSRVYSIEPLAAIRLAIEDDAFRPAKGQEFPPGLSQAGISGQFSTEPPVSLYGASKLASETLALEYGQAFNFPVWVNRSGVIAGAGQFCRPDQGIFSYWIHRWAAGKPLKYVGFNGLGHQVRDCLHPADLGRLVAMQLRDRESVKPRILNLGGGVSNSMSLRNLSGWCSGRFGQREVSMDIVPRPFDLPWIVMDNSEAESAWGWRPEVSLEEVLEEIARHAEANPDWLDLVSE